MKPHFPKHMPTPAVQGLRRGLSVLIAASSLAANAQSPVVQTDHDTYAIGEDISVSFSGGPGNRTDWIGVYPQDVAPGTPGTPSTIWYYVDGTRGGSTGLTEGAVTFPGGLNFAGAWTAHLLLNDGYTIAASSNFQVVEAGTPLVRVGKRTYETGESITVGFVSGPGNALDWIGLYKEGQTPGEAGVTSTRYLYVDGTTSGATGLTDGSVTFPGGLAAAGSYVAFFLLNDGYTVLASESFSVTTPVLQGPRLLSISPADQATNVPPVVPFTASITNGATAVVTSTVTLTVDGQAVPASVTTENNLVRVAYTNTVLFPPLSTHTYELAFTDNATPPKASRITGAFTTVQYENIVLPQPLFLETFDSTPEGQVPDGWTLKSYTEVQNPDFDLGNLDSASFANWLVIDVSRFQGSFVTYSNPDNPDSWENDYRRVLTGNPNNVLDGKVVDGPLASGRMLFGDSGYRNGASQVLSVTTRDYNLTGATNVHVVFKSLYEQNQDSFGGLEYSIDGGATWLPIAYLINAGDIVRTEAGAIDVEATLNTPAGDIASYTDDTGATAGGTYGAFIGAPISPALAPFIQGRIDDNASESKRIEKYRLPLADNAAAVRLRFTYAGTDSWYWGVDDFGLYSIGAAPPSLSATATPNGLLLSWPAGTTGYTLQGSASLSQPDWTPVPGVTGNSVTVPFTDAARYFRLN